MHVRQPHFPASIKDFYCKSRRRLTQAPYRPLLVLVCKCADQGRKRIPTSVALPFHHGRVSHALQSQYTDGMKPKAADIVTIRLYKAMSCCRWILTVRCILLALFAVAAFLGVAVNFTRSYYTSSQLGFGKVQPLPVLTDWAHVKTITESILVANL